MKERTRITVEIKPETLKQIQGKIKAEYPKLRSVSDVVREALRQFLKN